MAPPVLLVHGIWDDGARFDRMAAALSERGLGPVATVDLKPNDGRAPIERLAEQVERAAAPLLADAGRIDLVGFSMGALVSRYWVQRMQGKARTRRFVSISGPHAGTLTAWGMPFDGVRQMRPRSALLEDLASDDDPWGDVEVHTVWTPFDLMILPPRSSRLKQAYADHRLPVPMHRFMITDRRALDRVTEILGA